MSLVHKAPEHVQVHITRSLESCTVVGLQLIGIHLVKPTSRGAIFMMGLGLEAYCMYDPALMGLYHISSHTRVSTPMIAATSKDPEERVPNILYLITLSD
jgi:hypothetical protein